jgi:superfamily I DNA and/or RNA helicase
MNFNDKSILILIKNKKSGLWDDATNKIIHYSIMYDFTEIQFNNGNKYKYSNNNIVIKEHPQTISLDSNTFLGDGKIITNIKHILKFDQFYKVFFNGGRSSIFSSMSPYSGHVKADLFSYLKDLVNHLNEISSNEGVEKILKNAYEKLTEIPNDSVMHKFLFQKAEKLTTRNINYIFPFSFNLSQKSAIVNALTNSVSIVQGPPGTGKTQMILNLLANLIKLDKTVLIVSNNNEAIKNIQSKLASEDMGQICALLGKNDNKADFFEQISSNAINSNIEKNSTIDNSYELIVNKIDQYYDLENKRTEKTKFLNDLKLEFKHFSLSYPTEDLSTLFSAIPKNFKSTTYLFLKHKLDISSKISFFYRFYLLVRFKIKEPRDNVLKIKLQNYLEHLYYQNAISETAAEIKKIDKHLMNTNFEFLKEKVRKESYKVFKNLLNNKIQLYQSLEFTQINFKSRFKEFADRYPVILSTSFSVLNTIPENIMIDYLIVDEASQSDLISSTLPMMRAKNIVVVGDQQQLPAIPNPKAFEISRILSEKYCIETPYQYHLSNLLIAFSHAFPNSPTITLKEHYRCDPTIIGFSNRNYYRDELFIHTVQNNSNALLVIKTLPGMHARKNPNGSGMYNIREIDEVVKYINENSKELGKIGIITPFRIQAEEIRKRLINLEIEVDTVHRFQGREKDTIIISTVVNGFNETEPNLLDNFIDDYRLLNVAITRAKKKLILITSDGIFKSRKSELSKLIGYIKYNQPENSVKEGKVSSIFDELYKQETKIILNSKEFLSEKLTAKLLDEIMVNFPHYSYGIHVQLRKLSYSNEFTDDEKNYLLNPFTHVDFLIYSKLTYEPVLVIEVDGVKFHEKSPIQTKRDNLKNSILNKSDVRLLRLKTNESNERVRIETILNSFN